MRLTLLTAATLLVLTSQAFADTVADVTAAKDVIAAAELSDETNLAMWCGAAFTLVSANYTGKGDTGNAKLATDLASTLFGKAAPLLTADGVADADMGNIATQYMVVANAQTIDKTEPADFTQEECQAAAEAK